MSARDRVERTRSADALCSRAYADAGGPDARVALVAVGGFGRAELAPYSDLDVVLVHDDAVDVHELSGRVWYPLWDSPLRLDHAVRSVSEMAEAARGDLRVALGLLDTRHLAGDPNLTLRVRAALLAQWRREARSRLPELQTMVRSRHQLVGELAHASVPDLKEAAGGLRDATVLTALVATWLVDVPHADLERSRRVLLDVRDAVHTLAGRRSDRVLPEAWGPLAHELGYADAVAAQIRVRELGRRITHISRLTWRRVDAVLARPAAATGTRRPALTPLAPGVALAGGEVVLDARAHPDRDPLLLLRAAAEAAERDVVLAPATAARLERESAPLPEPWPLEARRQLVRLLAAGPGLLPVWETLDETGALPRFLPEWDRIRLLPHASAIHRFTVDRHVVETCVEAGALIRGVARADVLMVAALLHDIGKGGLTEHSVAGEPIARAIATRMGFPPDAVALIALLVRWHLLLSETATTRDPDDPATVDLVTSRVPSPEALSLLVALTEADARAASPQAWSGWRSGLVRRLAQRTLAALVARATGGSVPRIVEAELPVPPEVRRDPTEVSVSVDPTEDGSRITVIAADRIGMLADVAAALALQRSSIRGARAWSQDAFAVSVWEVAEDHLDPFVLRERFAAIASGRLDPAARLRLPDRASLAPTVQVRPEASSRSTVLEVRATDRPGILYRVCAALADLDIAVRSAHVDTLGPQAVDVFYLQESAAGALSEERAADAAHAVRAALSR